MIRVACIDQDGSVLIVETERSLAEVAHEALGGMCSVVKLLNPICGPGMTVGYVDDFGYSNPSYEINRKAWALYGRSPVVGPMVVGADDGRDLDPGFVTALLAGDEWMEPEWIAAQERFLAAYPTWRDG